MSCCPLLSLPSDDGSGWDSMSVQAYWGLGSRGVEAVFGHRLQVRRSVADYDQKEWLKQGEPATRGSRLRVHGGSGVSVSVGGVWEDMNGHGLLLRARD